jgi:hypothetical protein
LLGTRLDARALTGMALAGPDPVGTSSSGGRFRLQDGTASLFLQHLNTAFAVRSGTGARARLVLAEVVERPLTKNVEQFSLIFHAPPGVALPDGTHAVEHSVLGDFRLFIVSVGAPSSRRTVYQACFSRHLGLDEIKRGDALQDAPHGWRR